MKRSSPGSTQRIVICFCGLAGCGKSTVAKKLAEEYALTYLSGGGALKTLAEEAGYTPTEVGWWETSEGMKFIQQRMNDPKFDKMVDEKLIELAKHGNVILDSWTMPWLLDHGFNVWLEASFPIRAERVAKRDGINEKTASNILARREERTRRIYHDFYGFNLGQDFGPFSLILDTNELAIDEVLQTIRLVLNRLVFVRP